MRVPAKISAVFDFFSNAYNLNEITPPWLDFRIRSKQPILMQRGTRIDYQIKLHGLTVSWQSEIDTWEPPYRFVDIQTKGPYRKWVHTHEFKKDRDGTLVVDTVEYALFGWILEALVDRLFVKRDLERIFEYRRRKLSDIFARRIE